MSGRKQRFAAFGLVWGIQAGLGAQNRSHKAPAEVLRGFRKVTLWI